MKLKTFGAAAATAALVSLPLVACGSSSTPTVTTVTATTTALTPCPPVNDPSWEKCFDDHRAQRERDAAAKQQQPSAPAKSTGSGLPWWSWLLIVPVGLIGLCVLGFKAMEWNDERQVRQAEARVAELDARAARRASRVLDYDDFEEEDDDELPEDDIEFLRQATDPTPSAPAAPVQPAAGNLLSSLRQQGGVQ